MNVDIDPEITRRKGLQDPENAKWEEKHRRFRMLPGNWQLDSNLVDLATGKAVNVTAVERVSHYNSASFAPDGKRLLMTSLINGVSKPFVMDLDGRNKRGVSGEGTGFTYGYSASPDSKLISYHENYQVYIAGADGSNRRHIETGNSFNFAPRWSSDGQWLPCESSPISTGIRAGFCSSTRRTFTREAATFLSGRQTASPSSTRQQSASTSCCFK